MRVTRSAQVVGCGFVLMSVGLVTAATTDLRLVEAAKRGDTTAASAAADVNVRNRRGRTPLNVAEGYSGLSRSLLIFARGGCAVILCDSLGGRLLLGFEITEG